MSFDTVMMQPPQGAKTAHGQMRREYVSNPETNRDPPTKQELAMVEGLAGAKFYRKAREGKL